QQKAGNESSDSDNNETTVRHKRSQSPDDLIDNDDENCVTFRDGKRQIDHILVYEEWTQARNGRSDKYRDKYIANLRTLGVEMEENVVPVRPAPGDSTGPGDRFLHFVKLYVPFPVMCTYAEQLSLRAPLQGLANPSENWSDSVFNALRIRNPMYEYVPNKPLDYYTCAFKKNKLDKFL
ncbi:unnamed protein product, partial [Medioppia subpectinata]